MAEARLQAQVRALSREAGGLREELGREVKRRERLAVRARECEELQAAAEEKARSLAYINTKLEQELATLRERAQASANKNKGGLVALRDRLAEVEKAVASRAVEAQRQLQRVRGMVQELAAAAMPLSVVAAAAGPPGKPAQQPRGTAVRGGAGTRPAAGAAATPRLAELQQRFAQVLAGLSQLSEAITGHAPLDEDSSAPTTAAPLLLTAPDGSTKSVHWQGEQPQQQRGVADAEVERLRARVQQLQAELSAARSSSRAAASAGGSSSNVQAAVKQLEAVVPQYRAAASALQGQVTVLKEKLAGAVRERNTALEEASQWRGRAQQLEAALGQLTAKMHVQEAQALALSSQVQTQSEKLSGDVEALRQRCAELATALRGAQQEVARLQAAVGERETLIATQRGTIQQLEATIADQQEDIRSALDLVTSRTGAAAAGDLLLGGHGGEGSSCSDWGNDLGPTGLSAYSGSGWGLVGAAQSYEQEQLADPLAAVGLGSGFAAPAESGGSLCALSCSPRPPPYSPAASTLAQPQARVGKEQRSPGAAGPQPRPKSAGRGLGAIETEIAGLEDALRQALSDLNV